MEVCFSDGETEAPKVSASQSYGEQSISEKNYLASPVLRTLAKPPFTLWPEGLDQNSHRGLNPEGLAWYN